MNIAIRRNLFKNKKKASLWFRYLLLFSLFLFLAISLTGCNKSKPNTKRKPLPKIILPSGKLQFGPKYPLGNVPDLIVAKMIKDAKNKFDTSIKSAEIRGYLVDWIGDGIVELAVMKDGTLHNINQMNPSAAFGNKPSNRLKPEPGWEAKARKDSLAAAQILLGKIHPRHASVKPTIYYYIVKVYFTDGSSKIAWVEPDASAFAYDNFKISKSIKK